MSDKTCVIWKYSVPLQQEFSIEMPLGAEVLTVQKQGVSESIRMWCKVYPDEKKTEKRAFMLVGTGDLFHEENMKYINTFQVNGGQYVFHVFEIL